MIKIVHSPNGARSQTPKIIVVHAMGEYIGDKNWNSHAVRFLNTLPTPLSAHSLIAPENDKEAAINYRMRNDDEGAYHALNFNTDSLGIEFLVPGIHNYASFLEAIKNPYLTDQQLELGVEQAKEWMKKWPIEKIVRHSDLSPERKVDPGDGFQWQEFLNAVGL